MIVFSKGQIEFSAEGERVVVAFQREEKLGRAGITDF